MSVAVRLVFTERALMLAKSVGIEPRDISVDANALFQGGDYVVFSEQYELAFRVVKRVHFLGVNRETSFVMVWLDATEGNPVTERLPGLPPSRPVSDS